MKLSIIIVNYNVKYFLEQCLHSVADAMAGIDARVIVVDNYSTDGSRTYFNDKFPTVDFIWLPQNIGFGAANNRALLQVKAGAVLFLNPDTILPEDCLKKCLYYLINQPQCGALGVRMIDGSGTFLPESKRGLPGLRSSFFKMVGLDKKNSSGKKLKGYYASHLADNETGIVEVLSGAFMMLSEASLRKVKGFDEDFFMYGEDIDLSYRISKTGMQNHYFSDTTIIHFKGESSSRLSPQFNQHFYGAMQLFVNKHYNKTSALLTKVGIFLIKLFANKKGKQEEQVQTKGKTSLKKMVHFSEADYNDVLTNKLHDGGFASECANLNALLNDALLSDTHQHVLLCKPPLLYSQIISSVEKHGANQQFYVHNASSGSLVGSSNKNEQGLAIALV